MSEKQKQTLVKLAENIEKWDDEQRGYLLGYIEGVAQGNKPKRKKNKVKH